MDDTCFSGLDDSIAQAKFGLVRRSHSQRRRSANPSVRRFGIPKPPNSFGAQTDGQASLQRPPDTSSLPAHRKARRSLSISPTAHGDKLQQIEMCTGMADSVVCTRVARPASLIKLPFQAGICAAIASISRCSTQRGIRAIDSGAPRYLTGNGWWLHGNA